MFGPLTSRATCGVCFLSRGNSRYEQSCRSQHQKPRMASCSRCAHTGSQHRGISDGMHALLPGAVQPAAWHDMMHIRHGLWQECLLVWPCCERQHGCKATRWGPVLLHTSARPLGGCGKDSHRMRPPQPRLLPNMPGHLHAWSALPSLTQTYTQLIGSEHAEHTLTSTNRGAAATCLDERVQHCPRSTTTKGCGSGTE